MDLLLFMVPDGSIADSTIVSGERYNFMAT